jgi:general secretion pathway protein D
MKNIAAGILTGLFLIWMGTSQATPAEEETDPEPSGTRVPRYPTVSLSTLIERVDGSPHKTMLVEGRIPSDVVTGNIGNGSVKYPVFLTILRNNGLAAVVSDDVISIIPDLMVRSSAPRTIASLQEDIPADEWVTYVHRPQHASAPQLVPILRPLMPQSAHLAAFPEQNAMIIVDRFENVRRLVEIIERLDMPGKGSE